ncbi:glycosyltransferase family 2 protein [Woodsholea maritima]|uniref:glycosyltransferase family 2 protein n=1 Tax=Woodsholea maritima TaxID=240237 RepID=UPI000380975D|nr:glycosyltransferase [Woodsholea maritima]
MRITVLIPTYKRPDSLARALKSVFAQSRPPDEILVVDNAPGSGVRAVIAALESRRTAPVRYVAEPNPGVANVRNVGFREAQGDMIAMLDDDETASPTWLETLIQTRMALDTPVVFGPVRPQSEAKGPVRAALLARLYARLGSESDTIIAKPHGCGNSLIDRRALSLSDTPFDPATNEIGGEDDLFFQDVLAQGITLGWSAKADVIEHVEHNRADWRYMMARSFAFGQGASQVSAHNKNWLGVAAWMVIGAAQALIFGALILPARLMGAKACAACLDRAIQGAGKLCWFEGLEPRFYGAAVR